MIIRSWVYQSVSFSGLAGFIRFLKLIKQSYNCNYNRCIFAKLQYLLEGPSARWCRLFHCLPYLPIIKLSKLLSTFFQMDIENLIEIAIATKLPKRNIPFTSRAIRDIEAEKCNILSIIYRSFYCVRLPLADSKKGTLAMIPLCRENRNTNWLLASKVYNSKI